VQADILITPTTPWRGRDLLSAAYTGAQKAGVDARMATHRTLRPSAWLVLYGLGGADRFGYASRSRLMSFDLGYWERKCANRKFRVAVNGLHSPQLIMGGKPPGAGRWLCSGLTMQQSGALRGPVLLVGNGPKSNAVGANGWAAAKSRELKALGLPVLYRPKPGKPEEPGVIHDGIAEGEIEDVLARVSLVVCRHSNVAVDACRLGVPVVCEDGAAAAIYPAAMADRDKQPARQVREEFLHRLAWWQWSREEVQNGAFWRWASGALRAVS
jgi:hypothetical protein